MKKYPKRLIEVDLPIKRISRHARREKSIRQGHISTLHIWWARRPLAACRAVICATLWFDPVDPMCPLEFRDHARLLMREWAEKHRGLLSAESFQHFDEVHKDSSRLQDNHLLRTLLLDFIADFSNWDRSTSKEYLSTSAELTRVAHLAAGGEAGTKPLVVDPFAGGGAIPLEALRVGADTFASDLNPVAVLLNKVVLEYIPRYGNQLALEVRKWGEWVKAAAEKEIGAFYPKADDRATPIAYLWARTIICEGPLCGVELPLIRSLSLSKGGRRTTSLQMILDKQSKYISFVIVENAKSSESTVGTVKSGSATCPLCGFTTPVASVRKQLIQRRGGAVDARLLAIRQDDMTTGERTYRLPTQADISAAREAAGALEQKRQRHLDSLSLVPDEELDTRGIRHTWAMIYGVTQWADVYTPRQALALATFSSLIKRVGEMCAVGYDRDFAQAVLTCLAVAVSRLADFNSSMCVLNATGGRGVVHTFGRQALPMVWDFMETNPFNKVAANWLSGIETLEGVIEAESQTRGVGHVLWASATKQPLPNDSASAVITDPPYYDAIPYAYLSDFFYVWLRRMLSGVHPELFHGTLVPKDEEIVVDRPHELSDSTHDVVFYERELTKAFQESRRVLRPDGIGAIVFASKSTASWEAILKAVIEAGLIVTGSWPIDTEREARIAAQGQARLGSSIHLVVRPRENLDGSVKEDAVGDWRDVLGELPGTIHEWMPRLAEEGVVGADAIFACLGPALEIFSRYSRVEKASGENVSLREFLEHVWAAVSQEALNMIFTGADATGFEEDARLTAIWLWTISPGPRTLNGSTDDTNGKTPQSYEEEAVNQNGFILEYDAARKIAQGLGVHLEELSTLVEVKGDRARLLPVAERTKYLFKNEEAHVATKRKRKAAQPKLFEPLEETEDDLAGWGNRTEPTMGKTVLDRIHQSMILFAAGRGEALKRFLVEEGVGSDSRFWKLADSLNKLYLMGTDERRWIEGVLARKKGLGF